MTQNQLKCQNGFLQVGDIIKAYHAGYHKVTGIDPKQGSTGIVEYIRVDKKAKRTRKCDAAWCYRIDIDAHCKMLHEDIDELHRKLSLAKAI